MSSSLRVPIYNVSQPQGTRGINRPNAQSLSICLAPLVNQRSILFRIQTELQGKDSARYKDHYDAQSEDSPNYSALYTGTPLFPITPSPTTPIGLSSAALGLQSALTAASVYSQDSFVEEFVLDAEPSAPVVAISRRAARPGIHADRRHAMAFSPDIDWEQAAAVLISPEAPVDSTRLAISIVEPVAESSFQSLAVPTTPDQLTTFYKDRRLTVGLKAPRPISQIAPRSVDLRAKASTIPAVPTLPPVAEAQQNDELPAQSPPPSAIPRSHHTSLKAKKVLSPARKAPKSPRFSQRQTLKAAPAGGKSIEKMFSRLSLDPGKLRRNSKRRTAIPPAILVHPALPTMQFSPMSIGPMGSAAQESARPSSQLSPPLLLPSTLVEEVEPPSPNEAEKTDAAAPPGVIETMLGRLSFDASQLKRGPSRPTNLMLVSQHLEVQPTLPTLQFSPISIDIPVPLASPALPLPSPFSPPDTAPNISTNGANNMHRMARTQSSTVSLPRAPPHIVILEAEDGPSSSSRVANSRIHSASQGGLAVSTDIPTTPPQGAAAAAVIARKIKTAGRKRSGLAGAGARHRGSPTVTRFKSLNPHPPTPPPPLPSGSKFLSEFTIPSLLVSKEGFTTNT